MKVEFADVAVFGFGLDLKALLIDTRGRLWAYDNTQSQKLTLVESPEDPDPIKEIDVYNDNRFAHGQADEGIT